MHQHRNRHEYGDRPDLIVAHTSDLHLGGRSHAGGPLSTLRAVLDASAAANAQTLVLAGDVFDSHRAPADVIAGAGAMLAAASPLEIIILPGNHDPATPDAVYRRDGAFDAANIHIIGITAGESIDLAPLALQVSGVPHLAYVDMRPLDARRPRTMPWHVAVAHGHWVRDARDDHRGWKIEDDDIASADADYIALGHWDVPQPAGDGHGVAYYSGSPELAKTINIVRLTAHGVHVSRAPLRFESTNDGRA